MKLRLSILGTAVWLALTGCSTQQWYDGLQAGRRNACQRYNEPDRSRCLASSDMEYERYRRERDEMTIK